ncbi:hypothetical protein JW933_04790 [candidate division FCPU426 bacterium]|nr:hypothetical protein [candidate division FCPU426 bacterium]
METQVPIFGTVEAAARFWTFIFGLWAVCAVINVGLADLNGRNPIIWGLIGLVFGPLGVLIMLWRLTKKPKTGKTGQDPEKNDT